MVNLSVHSETAASAGVTLRFDVTDTGIGIPPDRQEVIFDPFMQADNSTTRHYGGSGLGLSVCRHLVEMLGGKIWLDSEVGRGSRFHFTAAFGVGAEELVAAAHTADSGLPTKTGLRVLLAEDNPINQRLTVRLLEKNGHSVKVACDGHQALEQWQRGKFDLILMDVQMPELDGLEVTAAIRKLEGNSGSHVPIIAMTAHALTGDRQRCLAAGMDGYIAKPFQLQEMLKIVSGFHDNRAASRQPDPVTLK
jgi:CheY-like chemotaxis protein